MAEGAGWDVEGLEDVVESGEAGCCRRGERVGIGVLGGRGVGTLLTSDLIE